MAFGRRVCAAYAAAAGMPAHGCLHRPRLPGDHKRRCVMCHCCLHAARAYAIFAHTALRIRVYGVLCARWRGAQNTAWLVACCVVARGACRRAYRAFSRLHAFLTGVLWFHFPPFAGVARTRLPCAFACWDGMRCLRSKRVRRSSAPALAYAHHYLPRAILHHRSARTCASISILFITRSFTVCWCRTYLRRADSRVPAAACAARMPHALPVFALPGVPARHALTPHSAACQRAPLTLCAFPPLRALPAAIFSYRRAPCRNRRHHCLCAYHVLCSALHLLTAA